MFCVHVLYVVVLCNVPDTFLGKISFNLPANFKNLNYVMPMNQFADIFSIRIAQSMLRTKRRIFSYQPSASNKSPIFPPLPFITTVSLMYEIKKIPDNPQPQIKMQDFILYQTVYNLNSFTHSLNTHELFFLPNVGSKLLRTL